MRATPKARARQLVGYFESGQTSQFYGAFSPDLKKSRTLANLTAAQKTVATQIGREDKMLGENFAPELGSRNTVYARFSQFSKSKDPVFTMIVINQQGEVILFAPRPMPA